MSLSVGDIATRLRIHPRQVEAIEREDLAALPAPAYVRGFVRNYAKELRMDPAPLIESLNRMIAPAQGDAGLSAAPLLQVEERSRLSRAVVITVAVGALLLFAVVGWLTTRNRVAHAPAAPEASAAGSAVPAGASAEPARPDQGQGQAASVPAATAPLPGSVVPPAVAPSPSAAQTPAVSAQAAGGTGEATLTFRFRAAAWVEVKQADGQVLLSQVSPSGSERTVSGRPPLSLTIGNAPHVSVEFRGQPVDLQDFTGPNSVARFTLK
jgi:cytoskeleton protein RodZ